MGVSLFLLLLAAPSVHAAKKSPEQLAIAISKRLKPISDDDWKTVAGAKVSEKYAVVKGDTLYDISKRMLGDPKYWPKLWALNNDSITNPHQIVPGMQLGFQPGTGTTLPAVTVSDAPPAATPQAPGAATPAAVAAPAATKARSEDWKLLKKQRWESVSLLLPPEVDPSGFDSRSKVNSAKPSGLELEAVSASERITLLGQVVGARTEGTYVADHFTIYIRADEEIQIGETYALTQEPVVLKSRKSDRIGYSYMVLGSVKIIGVRDNLFIGNVKSTKHFVFRGAGLMPMPKRVTDIKPVNGPDSLEATLMMDHMSSTFMTGQHKQVFIDRGTEDGVKTGMVFRAYQHYDPMDDRKITSSDFIIDGDIMVIQSSERFSVGLVLAGFGVLNEGAKLVLLTDVSELNKHRLFNEKSMDGTKKDSQLDDLEKLDPGGGIGKDEEKELQQLEKWKGNPPDATLPPDAAPPPPVEAPPDAAAPPAEPAPEAAPPPAPDTAPPPAGDEPPAPPPPPEGSAPGGSEPPPPEPPPPPPAN